MLKQDHCARNDSLNQSSGVEQSSSRVAYERAMEYVEYYQKQVAAETIESIKYSVDCAFQGEAEGIDEPFDVNAWFKEKIVQLAM